MSSEALELVRSIYADWSRGDYSRDGWADPDIEFEIADGVDVGIFRGVDEMRRAWRSYLSAWRDLRVEPEEFLERGEEVLVMGSFEGMGRSSGAPLLAEPRASLFTVRGSKVIRLQLWNDVEEARRAFDS